MNLNYCFRITMAAIAITGATVLSSCSHDDYYYNEEKAEQSVNEQYAIAFEKAFGKVGPNVDWGFSSKNTNARAFTRAVGTYAQYRGLMAKGFIRKNREDDNFVMYELGLKTE